MTPQLRFSQFTDEWQIKKIVDVGDVITGNTPSTTERTLYGDEYPFIGPGDMNTGRYVGRTKQRLSQKGFAKSRIIPAGSTLFVCIGSTIGKTAQIVTDSVTNQQINSVVPKDEYDSDFVYLALSRVANRIASLAGEQAVPIISKGDFQKNKLILPAKPEQEKIAEFLTAIDERIGKIEKKLELLRQYKKGVMQKIFTQQVRFKDEKGSRYPEWEQSIIADIAYSETSPLSANQIDGKSGQYKVYGASGILQTLDTYHYEKEYIAIVKDGAGVGRISFCEPKSSVLGTMIVVQPRKGTDKRFLYYLLNLVDFKKYTTGSTIPHVYFKQYSKQRFFIPKIEEQQKIAIFLAALDDKIKAEQTRLAAAKQWKRGLLQRMFV